MTGTGDRPGRRLGRSEDDEGSARPVGRTRYADRGVPGDYIEVVPEGAIALLPRGAVLPPEGGRIPEEEEDEDEEESTFDTDGEHTLVDLEAPTLVQIPDRDSGRPVPPPVRRHSSDADELTMEDLRSLVVSVEVQDVVHTEDAAPQRGVDPDDANTRPNPSYSPDLPLPAPVFQSVPDLTRPPHPANPEGSSSPPKYRTRLPPDALGEAVPEGVGVEISTEVAIDPLAPLRMPVIGGRYRVIERIGAGGMGKVFKVTHTRLGKTFALKIISDDFAGQNRARDLFYREARMASSLSHPNVTSVVDFGEDDRVGAFMVMEFLQGEVLADRLQREMRMSVRQASEIVRQTAEALDYVHNKGIVHCDIKTENILLTEVPGSKRSQLQVKLLDFGLARSTSGSYNSATVAGTPHYVAPERLRGAKASPSNDIYGLGILYYELLTGKVPWDGTVDEILRGHLDLEPVPPSQLIEGGLDPAVEKLVLRALAKDPASRHRNIEAFLYELRTVMDMLGYGRRRKRGRKQRFVAGDEPRRSVNARDRTVRALFDASRIPMALISREGVILFANPAFARFIMGVAVDVEGISVDSTTLVEAWQSFERDLARACDGKGVRRTIRVATDSDRSRRLVMWLDPGLEEDQAIFGAHPLTG